MSNKYSLPMWVINYDALEYPGKYVLFRWESLPIPVRDKEPIIISDTLKEARNSRPDIGLVNIGRWEGDDPSIVEVWL